MGQKVYPIGLRLGITEDWRSRWYAGKDYAKTLAEDIADPQVPRRSGCAAPRCRAIDIERKGDKVVVELWTARPGIVIGKKGAEVDVLRKELEKITGGTRRGQHHRDQAPRARRRAGRAERRRAARGVASAFRRAMQKAVTSAMKSGALGIRIQCSGRLGGAEMGRREWYREGRVPLHTLRAKIDYGTADARTTIGAFGVKVWVYHGEVLPGQTLADACDRAATRARAPARRRAVGTKGGEARCFCRSESSTARCSAARCKGEAKGGTEVTFGEYGLKALEPAWITNRQIEAARVAMTRYMKRGGKVWINIFPDKPVTQKPAETRMGSGKGNPEKWVAVVKPGRVMFEVAGVPEEVAKEAMRLAAHKLPIKTQVRDPCRQRRGGVDEGRQRSAT